MCTNTLHQYLGFGSWPMWVSFKYSLSHDFIGTCCELPAGESRQGCWQTWTQVCHSSANVRGWLKLAPRDKIRQYHGKKGWLISLKFNELLQYRIGVRAAKPFLSYSLQDSQVHRAKGQGWDPPLTVEWQLKKHFFPWGLLGIADWADLLPLACGLREGKRPLLP